MKKLSIAICWAVVALSCAGLKAQAVKGISSVEVSVHSNVDQPSPTTSKATSKRCPTFSRWPAAPGEASSTFWPAHTSAATASLLSTKPTGNQSLFVGSTSTHDKRSAKILLIDPAFLAGTQSERETFPTSFDYTLGLRTTPPNTGSPPSLKVRHAIAKKHSTSGRPVREIAPKLSPLQANR